MKLSEQEILEKCAALGIAVKFNPKERGYYDDEKKEIQYRNLKVLRHEFEHISAKTEFDHFLIDLKFELTDRIYIDAAIIGAIVVMYYIYTICSATACHWLPNPIFL